MRWGGASSESKSKRAVKEKADGDEFGICEVGLEMGNVTLNPMIGPNGSHLADGGSAVLRENPSADKTMLDGAVDVVATGGDDQEHRGVAFEAAEIAAAAEAEATKRTLQPAEQRHSKSMFDLRELSSTEVGHPSGKEGLEAGRRASSVDGRTMTALMAHRRTRQSELV